MYIMYVQQTIIEQQYIQVHCTHFGIGQKSILHVPETVQYLYQHMTIIAGFKKGYNIFVKTIICRLENCIRLGTFICFFLNQNLSKYTFVIVT